VRSGISVLGGIIGRQASVRQARYWARVFPFVGRVFAVVDGAPTLEWRDGDQSSARSLSDCTTLACFPICSETNGQAGRSGAVDFSRLDLWWIHGNRRIRVRLARNKFLPNRGGRADFCGLADVNL